MTAARPPGGGDAGIERLGRIPTATWSDALDLLGLPGVLVGLELRAGAFPIAGPVATVLEEVGPFGSADPSEFGIDLVLAHCRPGQVVVVRQLGSPPASALGGLAAAEALRAGLAGVVIDGACRDVAELREIGLPVMSRTVTPASGRGRIRIRAVNRPLRIGTVPVRAGDLAVADETGAVVLPADRVDELLALAEARLADDLSRAAEIAGRPARQT